MASRLVGCKTWFYFFLPGRGKLENVSVPNLWDAVSLVNDKSIQFLPSVEIFEDVTEDPWGFDLLWCDV